ncbi:MAG: glycosyltransferase family 4 protein [Alphaproteobacteria bacterium]
MPKLLSINNYHYRRGGAEVVYLEQNRLFKEVGWEVVPFSMKHEKNEPCEWSDYFIDELELGQDYSLFEKLKRVPKVIYSFEAQQKLNRLLDKTQPTVAHAHNIYHHLSPAILPVLSQRGIPTVLTLHDLKLACPSYLMYAHDGVCERCKNGNIHNVLVHRCIKGSLPLSGIILLEAALHRVLGTYTKHLDKLVTPSRFFKEKMIEWGWDGDRIAYVPNFVHAEKFTPTDDVGSAFLYLGRLSREKGLATLIKAAADAKVPLRVAGTGPKEAELKALAAASGGDIEFLGFVSGERLHNEVRQARALVLPSEWYENAPISVLEAYALGTPVIGAAIGGIPELLREDETGYAFPSGDVAALAEVLAKVTSLPDSKLAQMGRSGRAWVEQEFTADAYRSRLIDLYGQLGADIS